jgi:hypothetical protein
MNCSNASNPPADAPIPTIGNLAPPLEIVSASTNAEETLPDLRLGMVDFFMGRFTTAPYPMTELKPAPK